MSQSVALNPVVTRSGSTQALAPAVVTTYHVALQPKITVGGTQTIVPDPAP